jgi:hypothetical protein
MNQILTCYGVPSYDFPCILVTRYQHTLSILYVYFYNDLLIGASYSLLAYFPYFEKKYAHVITMLSVKHPYQRLTA